MNRWEEKEESLPQALRSAFSIMLSSMILVRTLSKKASKQGKVTMSRPSSSSPGSSAVELKLPCSLEELYKGSKRKLKLTRTILDANGTTTPEEKILKIKVVPGWKQGTRITFRGHGNEEPGKETPDVVFIVEEIPHETLTREGHDLVMRKTIPLVEALAGCRFVVSTLDGRRLSVDVPTVIPVGFEMAIVDEGMPLVAEPGRSGRLRIRFDVEFPARLRARQKAGLKRLLEA